MRYIIMEEDGNFYQIDNLTHGLIAMQRESVIDIFDIETRKILNSEGKWEAIPKWSDYFSI